MKLGLKTIRFSRTNLIGVQRRTAGWHLALITIVLLLAAGCSSFGDSPGRFSPWQESGSSDTTQRMREDDNDGWFTSLFRREEEPSPPSSVEEWMDLEPIRP